jgi:hypothetical protein
MGVAMNRVAQLTAVEALTEVLKEGLVKFDRDPRLGVPYVARTVLDSGLVVPAAKVAGILDRYADAQVAAERERIAVAIEATLVDAHIGDHECPDCRTLRDAARIARGQP